MQIDATRDGGSVHLRLGGRLDREWAGHLSSTLEELLRDGVRSLRIDLSTVTYISSAAAEVLARWQQEVASLRGEVALGELSPAVREMLAITGWKPGAESPTAAARAIDLRQSSWHLPAVAASAGNYQTSAAAPDGRLTCSLHGSPSRLTQAAFGPDDCDVVAFPPTSFGLGLGAIGRSYAECHEQMGELLAVAGGIATFPGDGARLPDYLLADGPATPQVVLASGLSCRGSFAKLVRFSTQPEADAVPLSELASVCLDAVGGRLAGVVIAAETAGLTGARIRRSPAGGGPLRFDVPLVRDWLSFAPERTYTVTTSLIAGVIGRGASGPIAGHLRPLGLVGRLSSHLHAAVFSYRALPQRTVELGTLVRGLFRNHQLQDVLHLLWDDRGEAGVAETALLRGVAWAGPITDVD
ncbi:MAG TPA: STAS domain-containing protein [Gemmatimonadales bacterium]|nr:STAS domain-containing protein [Gemmatimonadales bacterium]